jgi:hypothetical protein
MKSRLVNLPSKLCNKYSFAVFAENQNGSIDLLKIVTETAFLVCGFNGKIAHRAGL